MKSEGKNLCNPSKNSKPINTSFENTFKAHPVSAQLSFKKKFLTLLAIKDDIFFIIVSFLFTLIPPTNLILSFELYKFNNLII